MVQDHAKESHQVPVLQLCHHSRLIQEGLGCDITLDILHGHLLAQVLALQDGSKLALSDLCSQRQVLQVQ